MEILSKEEIKKLVKNKILLKIKEAKIELGKRRKKINDYTIDFEDRISDKFIKKINEIFNDIHIKKVNKFNIELKKENLSIFLKIDYFYENNVKKYMIKPNINNYIDSKNIIKNYIFMGEVCKHIDNGKFDSFINYVNDENFKLLNNVDDVNILEMENYISDLNYQLEKIRIDETFQEGNTFIFNFMTMINYGKRKRYDSTYADVLKIIKITPTMCVFKIKRNKNDKEWFSYMKEKVKTIKDENGNVKKIKEKYKTDLIKKRKPYIYKFIKGKNMNLIKTQSRALKLKNILDSE